MVMQLTQTATVCGLAAKRTRRPGAIQIAVMAFVRVAEPLSIVPITIDVDMHEIHVLHPATGYSMQTGYGCRSGGAVAESQPFLCIVAPLALPRMPTCLLYHKDDTPATLIDSAAAVARRRALIDHCSGGAGRGCCSFIVSLVTCNLRYRP